MNDKLLILDDEESIVDLLGEFLTSKGYDCDTAISPFEAIEKMREGQYALLLTDLHMPRMSGLDVVREAKLQDPDLAVVVVTALMEISNAIQAMRIGADDYVLKPFNLNEISLAVARALEKRRLLLENRAYQEQLSARVEAATHDLETVNRELLGTKHYLENLLHSTVDAIITFDRQHVVNFANTGSHHMFGYSESDLVGLPAAKLFAGGADEARYIERILRSGRTLQNYESVLLRQDGAEVPVSISLSYVRDINDEIASILAICKDITEQKRLERELKELSAKDSLTGLYNQGHFYTVLRAELERAKRQRHPLSLSLIDVDKFKTYNDCHGHLEGDKVLRAIADVIRECTRGYVDMAFRYGGDEYTVILPEADESQAYSIADRIRKGFEARRFDQLTLSIGLMTYRDGCSLRRFIQFTDAMMYDAKRAGGNQVHVYSLPDDESGVEAGMDDDDEASVESD